MSTKAKNGNGKQARMLLFAVSISLPYVMYGVWCLCNWDPVIGIDASLNVELKHNNELRLFEAVPP